MWLLHVRPRVWIGRRHALFDKDQCPFVACIGTLLIWRVLEGPMRSLSKFCTAMLLVLAVPAWAGDRSGASGQHLGVILAQYSQVAAELDAKKLAGTYDLYNLGRMTLAGELPPPSNRMVIAADEGDTFQVRSPSDIVKPENTWQGNGKLQGRRGYYDWKFSDGKIGRTDFVITADNDLIGYVQIADPAKQASFNWWYLAKRRR